MSTLERLERANPVPDPDHLLSSPGAMDEFVLAVKQGSGIRQSAPAKTWSRIVKPVEDRAAIEVSTDSRNRPPQWDRKRLLIPVLAGVLTLITVIAMAALLGRDSEPDMTNLEGPRTPLEVAEALNEATITGDWEAERLLYADDATFTDVIGTELASFLEPSPNPFLSDWDGDGVVTLLDEILDDSATDYAAGVTLAHTCNQIDPTTVVCEEVAEGHAFLTNSARSTLRATNTFTVVDGRVTHQQFDASPDHSSGFYNRKLDDGLLYEYRSWVIVNHPSEESLLFSGLADFPSVTRDTVEMHYQLIADWVGQR